MASYIQIEGDPTKWLIPEPIQASQLTGQPRSLPVSAPVVGTLVLSGKHGHIAFSNLPSGQEPKYLSVPQPTIYVPTPAGISEGHLGHELPASADLDKLASQIVVLMRDGHSQSITLSGRGTMVLNGATLPFAVLCMQFPPVVGGSRPSD